MENQMRVYYDEEGDYLTFFTGDARPNYGEDIGEDITIFRDEKTNDIIGVGILNFREKSKSLNELNLKLPFRVDFSMISS